MPRTFVRSSALLALGSLFAGGCGEGPPTMFPATGTVSFKGIPTAGIVVVLHPADESSLGSSGRRPSGETDAEGHFSLSTYAQGDGAPPGGYAVTLTFPKMLTPAEELAGRQPTDRLEGRYADPKTAKLRAVIMEGENSLGPFEVH